jgi:DNA modification methylase
VLPLMDGGAFYICAPPGDRYIAFLLALESCKLQVRQGLCWVKQQMVFGRQDYHYQHEMIIYGWKNGSSHYFVDDRTQTSIWEVDRPRVSAEHPTMKPIELPSKAIANSSRPGGIVYDPFLGSGTTMVAAENLGRVCFGIEIEPKYVAVILQRMTDLGRTPKLETT